MGCSGVLKLVVEDSVADEWDGVVVLVSQPPPGSPEITGIMNDLFVIAAF